MIAATLFDGKSARRQPVTIAVADQGLILTDEKGEANAVSFLSLKRGDSRRRNETILHTEIPGWHLRFDGDVPENLLRRLPGSNEYGGWIDRYGLFRAALVFATISAVLVGIVLTAPRWLAPLVPLSIEERIGNALVGDFAQSTCHSPGGDAALAKLMRILDLPGQAPVKAQVVKLEIVNAAALPGGHLIILSGLFKAVKDGNALAGVIGHELGHLRKRHVMQALIREIGLSVLLAGSGGTVPTQIGSLASLKYSRAAETEADVFAKAQLLKANISPLSAADFFARMATMEIESDWALMLSSHPASKGRARFLSAGIDRKRKYADPLSAAEWQALANMCVEDRQAKPLFDFLGKR